MFQYIYNHAGKITDYNITKKEWVLDGDFVKFMEEVNRLRDFYKLHKSLILSHSILTIGDPAAFSEPASEKAISLIKNLADRIEQEAARANEEEN